MFQYSFLLSHTIMGNVMVGYITNNLLLDSPPWHTVCVPSLGTCNIHCHVHRYIPIHRCGSTVGSCISSPWDHHLSRVRRRSAFSLTGPRTPCGRRAHPLPLLPPLPAGPGWPPPRSGPPGWSCHRICRFLSASTRLAVSVAINAWTVDSSKESVVDLSVSITPGIDLSLLLQTLVSSCTLSMRSLTASYWQSVYRSSWPIFDAMLLYFLCNMALFACSSLPCSSFNRFFLCASVMKGQ